MTALGILGISPGLIGGLVVWLIVPAIYLVLFVKHGREYRFPHADRYLRDPDVFRIAPAKVGFIWRKGRVTEHEINATILDLIDRGVIASADTPDHRDATLTDTTTAAWKGLERHEQTVMAMLFARDDDAVTTVTLSEVAENLRHSGDFHGYLQTFRSSLVAWSEKSGVFELVSFDAVIAGQTLGVIMILTSIAATGISRNAFFFLAGLPVTIAMLFFSRPMLREGRRSARIRAQAEALRRYLHDFGRLHEKPPDSIVLWGRYLVYAELFGLADETRRELERHTEGLDLAFGSVTWALDWTEWTPL